MYTTDNPARRLQFTSTSRRPLHRVDPPSQARTGHPRPDAALGADTPVPASKSARHPARCSSPARAASNAKRTPLCPAHSADSARSSRAASNRARAATSQHRARASFSTYEEHPAARCSSRPAQRCKRHHSPISSAPTPTPAACAASSLAATYGALVMQPAVYPPTDPTRYHVAARTRRRATPVPRLQPRPRSQVRRRRASRALIPSANALPVPAIEHARYPRADVPHVAAPSRPQVPTHLRTPPSPHPAPARSPAPLPQIRKSPYSYAHPSPPRATSPPSPPPPAPFGPPQRTRSRPTLPPAPVPRSLLAPRAERLATT
ncbi:hypothetical protein B0H15DRAFT_826663 [Mycena belliarum]|uniref:Uncharacterized protein n=1 Tax=Mycena belliarum TaxID=1033014 RepID=A0AAD6UE66_9AGAR|nr:hypothetical protein B0H15DRAFT_826663 [Mycena belliae]